MVDVGRDVGFLRVGFGDGFVFSRRSVPVAGFAEGAGAGFARFEVGGVEVEGAVAVGDGGFVVFELFFGGRLVLCFMSCVLMQVEGEREEWLQRGVVCLHRCLGSVLTQF